ncbi:lipopolysaccharide heptosyltransferase family protein [bacterium]|nr:lipopolysaccharide heptosyltransferase family protein [bacterium]
MLDGFQLFRIQFYLDVVSPLSFWFKTGRQYITPNAVAESLNDEYHPRMNSAQVRSILVCRGDALGDAIAATPILAILKEWFPEAKIHVLTKARYEAIFRSTGLVDSIIDDSFEYRVRLADLKKMRLFADEIRALKPDVMIGLWENPRYGLLGMLARIPIRVGHRIGLMNRLFYTDTVSSLFNDPRFHQIQLNMRLLAPLAKRFGKVLPIFPTLRFDPKIALSSDVPAGIPESYTVVHVDAGGVHRVLLPDVLAGTVKWLLDRGDSVVLIGRRQPGYDAVYELKSQYRHLYDCVDRLSLIQTIRLISGASLFIGSDSGPGHIAAAFGRRIVSYYFSKVQSALRWGPWGDKVVLVTAKYACADICRPTLCQHLVCRTGISVDDMTTGIKKADQIESKGDIDRMAQAKASYSIGIVGNIDPEWNVTLDGFCCARIDVKVSSKKIAKQIFDSQVKIIVLGQGVGFASRIKLWIGRIIASNWMGVLPLIFPSRRFSDFERWLTIPPI